MKLKFDPQPKLPHTEKLYRIVNNKRRYDGRFSDIRQLVNHIHGESLDRTGYWVNLWNALMGKL